MQTKYSHVQLNKIRIYGFHGVSAEEQAVGSWFEIDVDLSVRVTIDALNHDNLRGTVDYSGVLAVINKEFKTKSRLMEHLAHRTAKSIIAYSPLIQQVHIKIQKVAPPMPGNVQSSSVEFIFER